MGFLLLISGLFTRAIMPTGLEPIIYFLIMQLFTEPWLKWACPMGMLVYYGTQLFI